MPPEPEAAELRGGANARRESEFHAGSGAGGRGARDVPCDGLIEFPGTGVPADFLKVRQVRMMCSLRF